MDVATISLCGVSVLLFVQVAVGLAKNLGFPTKYAAHLAAGLSMICSIGVAMVRGQTWYYGVMAGVFVGAAACGIYDLGKTTISSSTNTSTTTE